MIYPSEMKIQFLCNRFYKALAGNFYVLQKVFVDLTTYLRIIEPD